MHRRFRSLAPSSSPPLPSGPPRPSIGLNTYHTLWGNVGRVCPLAGAHAHIEWRCPRLALTPSLRAPYLWRNAKEDSEWWRRSVSMRRCGLERNPISRRNLKIKPRKAACCSYKGGAPLRAERRRALASHWSYELNRHLGLMTAYKAEFGLMRRAKFRPSRNAPAAARSTNGAAAPTPGEGVVRPSRG